MPPELFGYGDAYEGQITDQEPVEAPPARAGPAKRRPSLPMRTGYAIGESLTRGRVSDYLCTLHAKRFGEDVDELLWVLEVGMSLLNRTEANRVADVMIDLLSPKAAGGMAA
jgi:hypothetical protein